MGNETPIERPDELSSQDRILDSAEQLFSQRGFYSVSLREITKDAGVDLALANYHFGPKTDLMRAVLMRRADEHVADLAAALDAAVARAAPRAPTVACIIRAFAHPPLEKLARGGGWQHYIHLLSYLANSQQQQVFLQPMNHIFDPIQKRVIALLGDTLPFADDRCLHLAFYMLQACVIHVYSEAGTIERLSDGAATSTFHDEIIAHMVPFFEAGFYRVAGLTMDAIRTAAHDQDPAPPRQEDATDLTTPDRILNAAELLFSEAGYYGVSLREITKAAGVDLALANYHFGPKAQLFAAVLQRRAQAHYRDLRVCLDDAVTRAHPKPPKIEALVRAFSAPVLSKLARGGDGWRRYIHLLSYLSNSQQQQGFFRPMNDIYDPFQRMMIELPQASLPSASPRSIALSFYMVQAALINIYSETGGIERLSEGTVSSSDFDDILDFLVPFFAAGFYRMAGE